MKHRAGHDPLTDYPRCWTCHQLLSAMLSRVADMPMGPRDADTLIRRMREMLAESVTAEGPAG